MATGTTILHVHIAAAGDVEATIDVKSAGTRECQVIATIGHTAVRIISPLAAAEILANWDASGVLTARLPERVPAAPRMFGDQPSVWVRIGAGVVCTAALIPGHELPTHLRVQIGALTWLIFDQTSWRQIREVWERVTRQFA